MEGHRTEMLTLKLFNRPAGNFAFIIHSVFKPGIELLFMFYLNLFQMLLKKSDTQKLMDLFQSWIMNVHQFRFEYSDCNDDELHTSREI